MKYIWHIVDRGWMNHKPSPQLASTNATVVNYNEEKYATLLKDESKFIKDWCYSFGKAQCESKVEYDVSSNLLRKYVSSLSATLGEVITSRIINFLEEHVFPHEAEMCFYLRKHLPIYDQSMNTPHEGHNFGIKSSSFGPRRYYTVVCSTKQLINLSYYDAMKFAKKYESFK